MLQTIYSYLSNLFLELECFQSMEVVESNRHDLKCVISSLFVSVKTSVAFEFRMSCHPRLRVLRAEVAF